MIGVFDSGIGGLTVLKALREKLPEHSFIYFGDTARTPYGNKSPETVLRYGREDAGSLIRLGAKLVVIACNTVSALAADTLRRELSVPTFEVIRPAVEKAVSLTKNGKIGIIGTRATISSGIYQRLLAEPGGKVEAHALSCPLFVPLLEEGWEGEPEAQMIVKKTLNPLQLKGIDTLILGCTHYPLLAPVIRGALPNVTLVDSAKTVAEGVAAYLSTHPEAKIRADGKPAVRILVSDITPHLKDVVASWIGAATIEKVFP